MSLIINDDPNSTLIDDTNSCEENKIVDKSKDEDVPENKDVQNTTNIERQLSAATISQDYS